MKNLVLITLLVFSVVALNAQENRKTKKEKRAEREAKLVEQTNEILAAAAWQFDATQMLPSQGTSRSLTTSYNVVLKDGNVNCYLPFFGRAYSSPYGGSDSPMTFEAPIEGYGISVGKKGNKTVNFSTKNKSDNVIFTFTISVNGSATLSVTSTNRQHISYYGNLVPIKEKEKK